MVTKELLLRVLKEPLLHFFIVGLVLFGFLNSTERSKTDKAAHRIEVNSDSLIRYLEFRAKVIQPEAFADRLEGLSRNELQALIDNFVRDEVLFREARGLGLDKDDFGARQRLIQQLNFINQGVVSSTIKLTEDNLKQFLELNRERYFEPATITFTHVFVNAQQLGPERASEKARALLLELNGSPPVQFHEAPGYGDRFLYNQNYVAKEASEIRSHFGAEMQSRLFELEPNENEWQGPFNSAYGSHLVLLTKKTERHLPDFQTIKSRLEEDAFQQRLQEELHRIEKSVVDNYTIQLETELENRLLGNQQ